MELPLKSGDPPAADDPNLVDAGTFTPVSVLDNRPGSGIEGNIEMYDVYGLELPAWSRVREVLRITRDMPKPLKAKIKGLGTLYVGEEGWEVR